MEGCEMGDIGWIIVFVGTGILLGIIAIWRMLRGKKSEYKLQEKKNSSQHAILALGVSLSLVGAVLMFHGSILGERTVSIATLTGILGAGTIAMSGARKRMEK
jgi:putative Mn2+ efflux pump MntP